MLARAGILEYEQIHIYNITNGERLVTYAIKAPAGSREVCANGAAAHRMHVGDRVIIAAYALLDAVAAERFQPRVLVLDAHNEVKQSGGATVINQSLYYLSSGPCRATPQPKLHAVRRGAVTWRML